MANETTGNPMFTRQDQLAPTGMHDTHLYDPAATDNQIVAMFETYERARSARDQFVDAGVESRAIDIVDRTAEEGGERRYESGGLWGALKSMFVPDEDAHGYAEGVERGHAMLVVRPRPEAREQVIHLLEQADPVDFDARLEEWRSAGWNGIHAGQTQYEATRTAAPGMAAATLPAGSATTTAAGRATDVVSTGEPKGTSGAAVEATGAAGAANPLDQGNTPYDLNAGHVRDERLVARDTARPDIGTPAPVEEPGRASMRPGLSGVERRGTADETIPVVEEHLRVGKREVGAGSVRVRSYVIERPVEEQVNLRDERLDVERRPTNRPISEAGTDPFRERTIEATATREEPVVSKEARVREEVGVRKDAVERQETVRDTVRRTEIEVDDGSGATPATGRTGPASGAKPRI